MFPIQEADHRSRDERRIALEDQLTEAQAALNAGHARLVALISEHLDNEYWGDHGAVLSATGFLTWKLGQTPSESGRLLEVASKLKGFPKIKAAFGDGSLSLAQVRILVAIAEPETEEQLVHFGLHLSGAQLARFAGHYRRAIRLQEDTVHRERFLRTHHNDDGSWSISGCLPSEHGAIIDKALHQAVAELAAEEKALEDDEVADPWGACKGDALLKLCESYLSADGTARKARERHTVVLHADLETLASGEGLGRIEGGGIVPGGTIERLLNDGASLVEMIHHGGNIVHVDKKRRLPNTPLRRALGARDKCCVVPSCNRTARLQSHHLTPYRDLPETTQEGLALPCPAHHRDLDAGRITVEKTKDGLVFRDEKGKVIERPLLKDPEGGIEKLNRGRGVEVTSETCLPGWGGEPGDMTYVADLALRNRTQRLRNAGKIRPEDDLEGPGP